MGGKTSKTTQQVTIPPEVMARYRAVNDRAETVAENPFRIYSNDANDFVAPINQTQQSAISNIQNAGASLPGFFNAATGYTAAGAGSANPQGLDIGQFYNPFTTMVADATAAGLRQQQGEQTQGAIGDAIRNGAFGGDRGGIAMANLARQQNLGFQQAMAPIYQQGWQQALGAAQQQQGVQLGAEQQNLARQMQAGQQFANIGAGLQGAQLQQAQALLGAGTLEQQTDQGGKQALYNQFLQEQGYPFQVAQFLANIAMGTGALSGSTTTTTQPAPFFSDRRLKNDVRRIGETDDGQPIYKFKYKNDPREQTHIGLMADEVEQHHPEAVGLAGGFKTVDYDAATEPRAEKAGGGQIGDPNFLSQIISNHASIYGQPGGAPRGASGTPGMAGRVPSASLPVGKLMTAGAPPQQQQSGLAQAAQTGSQIAGLVQMAGKAKDSITDGKGLGSIFKSSETAPIKTGPLDLTRRERDRSLDTDQIGRGYAMGGEVDTAAPEGLYAPMNGINIPDERQKHELAVAGKPPDQGKSPFSQIVDAGKSIAAIAGMFAEGGAVQPSDDELAVRTMLSEVGRDRRGNFNPQEALGIGSVINTRAKTRGLTPGDVVLENGQFEPWAKPGGSNDPMKHDPNSPQFKTMAELWARAKAGEDPTKGATHFYGPNSQAALGRRPPAWDDGSGQDFGGSRFLKVAGYGNNETVGAGPRAPQAEAPENRQVTPGLAGPGRGPQDAESSPFRHFAESALAGRDINPTTKKALMSENLWVPLLSGLGSMLASRSPYLGNAVGEGLVGGTKAYTDLNSQQQNLSEGRMRNAESAARMASSAPFMVDGRLMLRYTRPDGSFGVMSWNDYNGLSDAEKRMYKFDPREVQAAAERAGGNSPAGVQPSQPTQESQPSTTAGSPATPNPTVAAPKPALPAPTNPERPLQLPGATPSAPSPFGVMPHELRPPARVEPQQKIGGIELTPGEVQRAATVTSEKSGWGQERRNAEPDFFTPQESIAKGNETQRQLILPLAGTLASLPREKSIYTSGKMQEVAAPVMAVLNNLAAAAGSPGLVSNPESLAKQEEVRKLTNQLKQSAVSETQQRAFAAFQEMAEGLPSIFTSPGGQAKLIAQTMLNNQREIDRNNYFENWKNAAAGPNRRNAEWVRLSSREANQEFDKTYNRPFYTREAQSIERMFNDTVTIDGKAVPVLEVISMKPQLITPKRKEQLEREYGKGILRYFGIN